MDGVSFHFNWLTLDKNTGCSGGGRTNTLISCIEDLRMKLDRHRKDDLKEYPTRTIFVDPMLKALGWDVRDPDDVQLEYPTIDGKSVDYAPKINRKPVLFIEAKSLNDPLTDIKSITQVVGYASNAGVEWCILTNGISYKVYRSTEKAEAREKLLFEISLDPKETEGMSVSQIAEQFSRFSRDAMAKGLLDKIGEQVFTTGKIRKALDKLFMDPPNTLIRLIRSNVSDGTIKPSQIRNALKRLWLQSSHDEVPPTLEAEEEPGQSERTEGKAKDYGEEHHTKGEPQEVIELYRTLDKFCMDLDPEIVQRRFLKYYIRYSHHNKIFCCVRLRKSGLQVWAKLDYSVLEKRMEEVPSYIRDVSRIGHWGVGDLEIAIDSLERFAKSKNLVKASFEKERE